MGLVLLRENVVSFVLSGHVLEELRVKGLLCSEVLLEHYLELL